MKRENGPTPFDERNEGPQTGTDDACYTVNTDDKELSRRNEDSANGSAGQVSNRVVTTVQGPGRDVSAEGEGYPENKIASNKGEKRKRKWPPWRVVLTCVACFTVQFTLGSIYSAGNMLPYLTSYLHVRTDPSVGYVETVWFSASFLISVSASMPLWGLLENHLSPWLFRLLGIVLYSGSYLGASWAVKTSFALMVMCLGVAQGFGQAILYPVCLSLPMQWLPESRGLLGGLIVAGFGGGGFLWDQVITNWINPHNLQPDVTENEDLYFSQTTVLDHVPTCYLLLGCIMLAVQILCLLCMSYPSVPLSDGTEVKVICDNTLYDVISESSSAPANENSRTLSGHGREQNRLADNTLLSLPSSPPASPSASPSPSGSPAPPSSQLSSPPSTSALPSAASPSAPLTPSLPSPSPTPASSSPPAPAPAAPPAPPSAPALPSPSPASPSPESPSTASSPMAVAKQRQVDGTHEYRPSELFRSRAMWTITIYVFFLDLTVLIISPYYKSYGQTFVHNDRLLSIMASFSSVVNAVCRPVWGFLADRHGFHVCLIFSQGFLALGSALLVICERAGAAMLFLVVCLVFLGMGGMYGLIPPLVCSLFGSKSFTFNFGFLSFSGILGALIDVYVVQAAKNAFGWQGIFLAASTFTLLGLLFNWSLVCDCGHPLRAHIKGALFHLRQSADSRSDVRKDAHGDPHQDDQSRRTERIINTTS